jgi:hypothetical protein
MTRVIMTDVVGDVGSAVGAPSRCTGRWRSSAVSSPTLVRLPAVSAFTRGSDEAATALAGAPDSTAACDRDPKPLKPSAVGGDDTATVGGDDTATLPA